MSPLWRLAAIIALLHLAVLAIAMMLASHAIAQTARCFAWEELRAHLERAHDERPIGGGLVDGDRVIVVLSAPRGETFTLVVLATNGIACLIGSGYEWDPGRYPPIEAGG